jgi:4-aminobutyrate--pyruvate transaminase
MTGTQTAKPNSLSSRDIAYQLHPYTNMATYPSVGPLIITRGEGIRVFDDSGKPYIDALAGLWCCNLGFGPIDRLTKAATEQMGAIPYYHTFAAKSTEPSILLAEKLVSMAPVPMSKVIFANSGSEANDTAIKLVWYYNNALGRPKKKKIISRIKAYHGVTVATASLTGLPNNHRDFDLPIANILHTSCPHHYRFAKDGESEEAFATRCAAEVDQLIQTEGPDTVAAMIGEPLMGAGGVIFPPATYWEKIQAVLKKHDVLLIADEVICGFGRTGNTWGSQTYGMKPDMLAMAKGLTAAYLPMSALLVSDAINQAIVKESEKIGVFGHGFTYGGHPTSAAVGLETQKLYEEWGVFENARKMTPVLQEGLRRFAGHPLVGEVRGIGMIGAIEMVKDKKTKEAFSPTAGVGAQCAKAAQARGLILRANVDTIPFCPPLVIDRAGIEETMNLFGQALDDTLSWARDKKLVA